MKVIHINEDLIFDADDARDLVIVAPDADVILSSRIENPRAICFFGNSVKTTPTSSIIAEDHIGFFAGTPDSAIKFDETQCSGRLGIKSAIENGGYISPELERFVTILGANPQEQDSADEKEVESESPRGPSF